MEKNTSRRPFLSGQSIPSEPVTPSSADTSPNFFKEKLPRAACSKAARTGAFACLVPGDWEGMPRRNELAVLAAGDPVAR